MRVRSARATACRGMMCGREQRAGEGAQVLVDVRAGRQVAGLQRLGALAGQHEVRHGADFRAGLQVAQRVADHRHAGEIDVEAAGDFTEHAGLGLAAVAPFGGGVRAEEDRIDAAALRRQRLVHLLVHGVERGGLEQSAPDARLVGGDHHLVAGLVQFGDRLQAALDGDPLVRRLDELVAVEVDDAIAVQDHELRYVRHVGLRGRAYAASLEMSATRFIRPCSSPSRARRLSRSAVSSAITITPSKKLSTASRRPASVLSAVVKSPRAKASCTCGSEMATAWCSARSASS